MIIRLFRTHQNVQLLVFLLAALLLWGDGFYRQQAPVETGLFSPFYTLVFGWAFPWPWFTVVLAFLMVVGGAYLFNLILVEEGMSPRNTFLPAVLYLLFFSFSPGLLKLHPAIPANLLFLLALRMILKSRHFETAYAQTFSAAILISLASFFDIYYSIFFFVIWVSLVLYRSYTWREWIISFLGLITPYFYLACYYFFTDQLFPAGRLYAGFLSSLRPLAADYHFPVPLYVVWGWLALFVVIAFFKLLSTQSERVIQLRKAFMIIVWTYLLGVAAAVWVPQQVETNLALTFLPSAVFLASWMQSVKRSYFIEGMFWVLIAGMIYLKMAL